jgi:DNA-binding CsgD family transcriptional regulator
LKQRELEVISLAANGRSNAKIGEELHISEETVKSHMRRANKALESHDRAHAVALAITMGLLPMDVVSAPRSRTVPQREQLLLSMATRCLGRDVCLRLIDGKIIPCSIAAILPKDTVGIFVIPTRAQHCYRVQEIYSITQI